MVDQNPHEDVMDSYSLFEHTADVGIDIEAETLEGVFAVAGRAFCELTAGATALGGTDLGEPMGASGVDLADLLVSFLSELLFMFDARSKLLHRIEKTRIRSEPGLVTIEALCRGRLFDRESEKAMTAIKAVTHHRAMLEKSAGGIWVARVLFDI